MPSCVSASSASVSSGLFLVNVLAVRILSTYLLVSKGSVIHDKLVDVIEWVKGMEYMRCECIVSVALSELHVRIAHTRNLLGDDTGLVSKVYVTIPNIAIE